MSLFNDKSMGIIEAAKYKNDSIAILALKIDDAILLGKAPVTGIAISQGVDYALNKTLKGDFLLTAFGDKPVTIKISGLISSGVLCSGTDKGQAQASPMQIFTKYKLSSKTFKRATLSMSVVEQHVFSGALIDLQVSGGSDKPGMLSYELLMIGVRK